MIKVIFESHATTLDNEAGLASGHFDVRLSELGRHQAQELGERNREKGIDAIFCSDLQRSYRTAEIAFQNGELPIIQDSRLRELDYGDFTKKPAKEMKEIKLRAIDTPMLGSESCQEGIEGIKEFLLSLFPKYDNKTILIIGHRLTQYGLEHWINGKSISDCLAEEWNWQPGWVYNLDEKLLLKKQK